MKMQNPLNAPVDGEVKGIFVKAGDSVAVGQVLVDIG
jgi:biotin carboxyl carrier protein